MNKQEQLERLYKDWVVCEACPLHQKRKNFVFGYGNPDASILIVAEAPGEEEDIKGIPLIGPSGKLLDQYLASVSHMPEVVSLAEAGELEKLRELLLEDIYITNVVGCRPPDNRDPTNPEIAACLPRLLEIIYIVDPLLIISMGRIATTALMKKNMKITKSRGNLLEMEMKGRILNYKIPVIPILHTSYLLRVNDFSQSGGMSDMTFKDILKAHQIVDKIKWLQDGTPIPKRV